MDAEFLFKEVEELSHELIEVMKKWALEKAEKGFSGQSIILAASAVAESMQRAITSLGG